MLVTDHPLFDIIGGHPLTITILASLRNELSLCEIYDLLETIKSNSKSFSKETLTFAL